MLIKQFHDEAVRLTDNPRISESAFRSPVSTDSNRETVLPLVVRLLLKGWITDKEKVFLDKVAPEDCLTFLLNGKTYVHPEGLDLFPFDEIETTVMHGGEAIFSHRYRPPHMKDSHQEYRIFSAAINPGEPEKIILGFFGPAHRLGTMEEDCDFSRLVGDFRNAYWSVRDELGTLRQYLDRKQATVLVSRSTGKVQALNDSASTLFSRPDRAMVDISLDQLKYHIAPLLPDYNLKMENIAVADLGISVVTLERNLGDPDITAELTRLMSSQFTASAANLSLAGSRLCEITSMSENDEKHQLGEAVQYEADKLRLASQQLSLISQYKSLEPTSQDIDSELEKAVRAIYCVSSAPAITRRLLDLGPAQAVAPPQAVRVMFESILSDHHQYGADDRESQVVLETTDPSGIRVLFETLIDAGLRTETINSYNSTLAEYIAGLIGFKVVRNLNIENDVLITELTFNK
ncbi:MAG: hypothetical protein JSV52_06350 [Candidatus Zixiibacteriota bacterium]|nr:MAG: hypothetical protein JSV52_06350 [candidate division Zixibacteria bacterium]